MGTYFMPWRRKVGVTTLMMACAFGVECFARTQAEWDNICPVDVRYLQCFAIAPLTLLSAFLLLSKPRQKPSAPAQDVHQ